MGGEAGPAAWASAGSIEAVVGNFAVGEPAVVAAGSPEPASRFQTCRHHRFLSGDPSLLLRGRAIVLGIRELAERQPIP